MVYAVESRVSMKARQDSRMLVSVSIPSLPGSTTLLNQLSNAVQSGGAIALTMFLVPTFTGNTRKFSVVVDMLSLSSDVACASEGLDATQR